MVDLDRYFARIGYTGSRTPDLATLNALAHAHVLAIPFENLDVLLGRAIDLETAALEAKLVEARRGGYCFEQNSLMLEVLRALGYDAHPISARVRLGRPRDYLPARTHVFVRVELDESWLVDVGVGAMSPTCALRLADEAVQVTPHEPRRLVREGRLLFHQVQQGTEWLDVCEFTLEEMPMIDRVVANWYTSAHPQSHFKNRLVVARGLPDGGRVGLLNRTLTIRGRDGAATHKRELMTPGELLAVLQSEFGLGFPAGTRFPCEGLDWP